MIHTLSRKLVASAFARMGPSLRENTARLVERDYEAITYHRIAARGYQPAVIIDVGAYHGNWTSMARRIFGTVPTLMIEAQEALIPNLKRIAENETHIAVVDAVLAARHGDPIDFLEMGTGSSIFPEASNASKRTLRKLTRRLDDVVSQTLGPVQNAFLKVDVQGAELEVLAGGQKVLANCSLVQLELALLQYNRGAPLMSEVLEWMAQKGWLPTDVSGFSRPRDHLVQIDMLFAPRSSDLRPTEFRF